MDDWRMQIAIAFLVKQEVAKADVDGLWPFHLPELAASEQELCSVEKQLGLSVDPRYRDFLSFADGWKGFCQAIDLFGSHDLVGGALRRRADDLLLSLEPLDAVCGIDRKDCLPIGVSRNDIDVIFIATSQSGDPGAVYWFAGQLIDRFPNFDEFFLAMVDYNRSEAEALRRGD